MSFSFLRFELNFDQYSEKRGKQLLLYFCDKYFSWRQTTSYVKFQLFMILNIDLFGHHSTQYM